MEKKQALASRMHIEESEGHKDTLPKHLPHQFLGGGSVSVCFLGVTPCSKFSGVSGCVALCTAGGPQTSLVEKGLSVEVHITHSLTSQTMAEEFVCLSLFVSVCFCSSVCLCTCLSLSLSLSACLPARLPA